MSNLWKIHANSCSKKTCEAHIKLMDVIFYMLLNSLTRQPVTRQPVNSSTR